MKSKLLFDVPAEKKLRVIIDTDATAITSTTKPHTSTKTVPRRLEKATPSYAFTQT